MAEKNGSRTGAARNLAPRNRSKTPRRDIAGSNPRAAHGSEPIYGTRNLAAIAASQLEVEAQARQDAGAANERRVREVHQPGDEPVWLELAKRRYREIGTCISLVSYRGDDPTFEIPAEVRASCEAELRRFVAKTSDRSAETIELRYFLMIVDDIAGRRTEVVRRALDAKMSVADVAILLYSMVSRDIAARLGSAVGALAALLERWPDRTARKPTRWDLAASVWGQVTSRELDAQTVRGVWNRGPGPGRRT